MAIQNGIALIIHGYGLYQSDWQTVMWGDLEQGLLGRVPMGLLIAYKRRPDLIIWNTGSTEKDGLREADYIFKYTLEHLKDLPSQFVEFQDVDTVDIARNLLSVSTIEDQSMRTSQALEFAIPYLTKDGSPLYEEVVHVSSKNHVLRVLRDAIDLWWEQRGLKIITSAYPAETGYSRGTAGEVQITELIPERGAHYNVERFVGLLS